MLPAIVAVVVTDSCTCTCRVVVVCVRMDRNEDVIHVCPKASTTKVDQSLGTKCRSSFLFHAFFVVVHCICIVVVNYFFS
ncbi:MAG: hypothetical protein J3R72DRAFT_64039 [Linnemannia gamsii]|nr:MAG: hypothetical protein J3R72DRAFT_64039 [Linnemannia gamsii]